jgi:hypothetical protein
MHRDPRDMLNPNTVYRKTDLGIAEIAGRKLGLRAELRRLLILIDGKNTVSRLATFVRDPEIESLLLELQAVGVIDASDGGSIALPGAAAATSVNAAPSAGTSTSDTALLPTHEQFIAARTTSVRFVNELLGPSAETLALKLERARDARELREAVSQVKQSLERAMGEAVGQRFLEAVRSAVKL